MAARMRSMLSMVFLFSLSACDEGERPVVADPWLELGSGLSEFVQVSDGDTLPLVYGIQGGWHVDTAARLGGIDLDGAFLTYDAFDPDSGELLNYSYEATLSEALLLEQEDGWLRLGDRVVFDVASDTDVLDRTIRIEATLTDAAGNTWQDTRTVVVVSP